MWGVPWLLSLRLFQERNCTLAWPRRFCTDLPGPGCHGAAQHGDVCACLDATDLTKWILHVHTPFARTRFELETRFLFCFVFWRSPFVAVQEMATECHNSVALHFLLTMGINDLLKQLLGGSDFKWGIDNAGLDSKSVHLDPLMLVASAACVVCFRYLEGNYYSSAIAKGILMFLITPTGVSLDGHNLGKKTCLDAYCAIYNSGRSGPCIHCAQSCWIQYHHWGEGRPTENPKTAALCGFVQGHLSYRECRRSSLKVLLYYNVHDIRQT